MKKLLRILGISFAVFIGILFIFYLLVRIKFPPDRIRSLAEELAAQQFRRRLDVESIGISPFSGFELKNVTLYDSLSSQSAPFFQVKIVYLHYHFLSVLKKRIEIEKIVIESPQLFIRRNGDGKWNFSDLLSQTSTSRALHAPSEPPNVPGFVKSISFQLKKFALTNAGLRLNWQGTQGALQAGIGPVSVWVSNLNIPGFDPAALLKRVGFDLQIKSTKAKIFAHVVDLAPLEIGNWRIKEAQVEEKWRFNIRVQKKGENHVPGEKASAEATIALHSTFNPGMLHLNIARKDSLLALKNKLPAFQFALSGKSNLETARFEFPQMQLTLGKFLSAQWNFSADSLLRTPILAVQFSRGQLDFPKLLAYAKGLNVGQANPFEDLQLEGQADFSNMVFRARANGHHLHLLAKGNPKVQAVSALYAPLQVALNHLSASLNYSGEGQDSVFTRGAVQAQFSLDSFEATPSESLSVNVHQLQGSFSTQLGQNFVPRTLTASLSADSLLGGSLNSYSSYKVAPVSSPSALRIQDFSGTTEFQVHHLPLNALSAGNVRGHVDIGVLASANYGMNAFFQTDVHSEDLHYLYGENLYEPLPKIQFVGKGNLRSSPGFAEVDVQNFRMAVNEILHGTAQARIFPSKQKVQAVLQNLNIDLSKIRPFLPSDIQETLQLADWNGEVVMKAQAKAQLNPQNDSLEVTTQGNVAVAVPYFINNEWFLNASRMRLEANFSGTPGLMETHFQGEAGEFMLKDVLAHPLRQTSFSGQANLENLETLCLQTFDLSQPDLNLSVHASGHLDSLSGVFPHIHLGGHFGMNLPKAVPVLVDVAMAGKMIGKFRADSREKKPQIVRTAGEISLEGFTLDVAKTAQAKGIHGVIPFRMAVDLQNSLLVPSTARQQVSFPFYDLFQPYYFKEDSLFRQITIDTIRVLNYQMTDFQSDIRIRNGIIFLPKTQMHVYDGNIVSQIWLNLGTGVLDDMAYAITAQVARVNSAKFPGSRGKKRKKSLIAASVHFQGKGVDIEKGLDVQGGVEVTQMGPETTDNLLRSLDPKGVDKSIQQVRQLIRFGSKPGLISFQIRHGNLYPRIQLIQPWYLPFKVSGGQVVLSRIPLSFVVNLALQSAEPVD